MQCCHTRRTKGAWKPFKNDCHKVAGDCLDTAGLANPGAPGGRFGKPCDSCDSK
jgi:hypothetical protein